MTIILYENISEDNQVNKELRRALSLEGALREDTSIQDPVITFGLGKEGFTFNYAYIPEFKRYYFITGSRVMRTGIVQITMHVDVLMSFKDEFLQNKGYIETSFNYGNFYLVDNNLPVQQDTKITTHKTFRTIFSHNGSVVDPHPHSYVMNCTNCGEYGGIQDDEETT